VRSFSFAPSLLKQGPFRRLFARADFSFALLRVVGKPVYARLGFVVTGPALRGDEEPDQDVRRRFLSLSSDALPSPCQTKRRLFSTLQILWPMAYRPSVEAGAK
jgi:hypothetical protein